MEKYILFFVMKLVNIVVVLHMKMMLKKMENYHFVNTFLQHIFVKHLEIEKKKINILLKK